MKKPADASELGPLQLIILVLSFVALGALVVELVVVVPPEAHRLFRWIDNLVCIFFYMISWSVSGTPNRNCSS